MTTYSLSRLLIIMWHTSIVIAFFFIMSWFWETNSRSFTGRGSSSNPGSHTACVCGDRLYNTNWCVMFWGGIRALNSVSGALSRS